MAERNSLDTVDPKTAWLPWQPSPKDPWNLKWAGHLYRRAAFGAPLRKLRFAVDQGLEATVNDLMGGDETADGEFRASEKAVVKELEEKEKNQNAAPEILQSWWIRLLFKNGHPLREKMTLFWHNHFVSSIAKVQKGIAMFNQNRTLRAFALKNFGKMLRATAKDAAMLIYLDSNSNVKGKPNENYAREVMELFSLGVGNYSEKDIQEAARAFTGWHVDKNLVDFFFDKDQHDFGPKKVLGREGNLDGGDVLNVLLEQPCCATFLIRKMYRYFISETAEPSDALIEPLAERYRKSSYDTGDLVKTMLLSRHFFSEHAYHQRIKSPVEFVFGVSEALKQKESWRPPESPLVGMLEAMGQTVLAPPNVKGWPGGKAWLNTSTMLARHNFAQMAAAGQWPDNSFGGNILGGVTAEDEKKEGDDAKPPEADDPPDAACDVAEFIRREKCKGPEEIVNRLVDLLLQDAIPTEARTKLVAYMSEAKEDFASQAARVRAATHLIMTMPQYQLA
jgi:uncharacterized protein (DUF1800 family)